MIGWVDASAGASGDMLLGALVGAGVPVEVMVAAVAAVAPEPVALRPEPTRRGGLAAVRCHVEVAASAVRRSWPEVVALLDDADLGVGVRTRAQTTFERLAVAEAAVHGVDPAAVHFHEVGALDAIADVVGVCAGVEHLTDRGLAQLVVSPVAVGSGRVAGAHGSLPVPVPAVVELLRGVPTYAGPTTPGTQPGSGEPLGELCTPTGAALLVVNATGFGPQPPMSVGAVGAGAGARDPAGHANLTRLLLGEPTGAATSTEPPPDAVVLETNVDDLDPRLWPDVLAALLAAGAGDAWLTPILMKKGRPAHTLHVLARPDRVDALRSEVFRQTSTIGLREVRVAKTALDREMRHVVLDGHRVAVKVARLRGEVSNLQPEYADVVRAARATGRPVHDVLADAQAAARRLLDPSGEGAEG